jgi:hypothetical protein
MEGLYLLYFVWRFSVIGFWDWFALVVFSGINFFIYRGLSSYARPTLGENGEIVSPGTDLHSKGLVEYVKSSILQMFVYV